MTIYFNDDDNNPLTDYTITLTGNVYESIVLGEGVDLNLNGFGVVGGLNDINSVGISSNWDGCEVYGGSVNGFGSGVVLAGDDTAVGNMTVVNSLAHGITVWGNGGSIYNNAVAYIGSASHPFYGAVTGIVSYGDGGYLANNTIHSITASFESVGIIIGGSSDLVGNNVFQGYGSGGWSIGLWTGGVDDTVNIDSMTISGMDSGIGFGSPVTVNMSNSSIEAFWNLTLGAGFDYINDDGGNFVFVPDPQSGIIYGTGASETIVGGDGDDQLAGLGSADTMIGGLGADTFIFSPGAMSVAPEYDAAQGDAIYLAYNYSTAVVAFDQGRHVLQVDGVDLAWLPYANTISDVAYHF